MNRLLIIILILTSTNLYAWPWSKNKEIEVCHYSLQVVGEEGKPKVYYIYKAPCESIELVAIISEPENKIIHVYDLSLSGSYQYTTVDERLNYLEKNFPNISPIPFYSTK